MSVEVTTKYGTIRKCVGADETPVWLLWCGTCQDWERLSEEQMEGRVSVNHAATGCPSGYHETHDFARQIIVEHIVNGLLP